MKNGTLINYEPISGADPRKLLDRHPDGCLVALTARERAGVWDNRTGRLVWAPADTLALCWMPGGQQILLLKENYERSPDHPQMIVTPLQSEYRYSLERRSWPEKVLLHSCEIKPRLDGWAES